MCRRNFFFFLWCSLGFFSSYTPKVCFLLKSCSRALSVIHAYSLHIQKRTLGQQSLSFSAQLLGEICKLFKCLWISRCPQRNKLLDLCKCAGRPWKIGFVVTHYCTPPPFSSSSMTEMAELRRNPGGKISSKQCQVSCCWGWGGGNLISSSCQNLGLCVIETRAFLSLCRHLFSLSWKEAIPLYWHCVSKLPQKDTRLQQQQLLYETEKKDKYTATSTEQPSPSEQDWDGPDASTSHC